LRLAAFGAARFATARVGRAFFFARTAPVRLAADRLAADRLAEDRLTEGRPAAAFRLAVERVLVGFFFFAARLATPASG
jgi:hypothetical protein